MNELFPPSQESACFSFYPNPSNLSADHDFHFPRPKNIETAMLLVM
jgi:hypothetical protein